MDSLERTLQEDHLELDALIPQLKDGRTETVVAHLAVMLPAHFESEERPGGFFERLERQGMVAEVTALRAQHVDILARLDALRAPGRSDPEGAAALASLLERHEWQENCLAAGLVEGSAWR